MSPVSRNNDDVGRRDIYLMLSAKCTNRFQDYHKVYYDGIRTQVTTIACNSEIQIELSIDELPRRKQSFWNRFCVFKTGNSGISNQTFDQAQAKKR